MHIALFDKTLIAPHLHSDSEAYAYVALVWLVTYREPYLQHGELATAWLSGT